MSRLSFLFLVWLVAVEAGVPRPEISISLDSVEGKPELGALTPNLKWTLSGSVADCDLDGGMNLKVDEKGNMPYTLWGKIKNTIAGCNVAARFDTSSEDMNRVGVDLMVTGGPAETTVQIKGSADMVDLTRLPDMDISSVRLSQSLDFLGGTFTLQPGYNIPAEQPNVKVAYAVAGAAVVVDANPGRQKLTVVKELGDKNRIAPSITSDGDVALQYSRAIRDGTLTATMQPKNSLNLSWSEGKWNVNLNVPLKGTSVNMGGIKLSATCSGI